jgi:hypothetical protein
MAQFGGVLFVMEKDVSFDPGDVALLGPGAVVPGTDGVSNAVYEAGWTEMVIGEGGEICGEIAKKTGCLNSRSPRIGGAI